MSVRINIILLCPLADLRVRYSKTSILSFEGDVNFEKEKITDLFYRDVAVWENRRNGGTVCGDGRHDCLIRLLLYGAGHLEHQCKFRTPFAQSKLVAADNYETFS